MKTLKFRPYLIDSILNREKTTTWRLFDEKDIKEGDELKFLNWETGEEFARAAVVSVSEKSLGDLDDEDWEGHEKFSDQKEMYKTYSLYYKMPVDENTKVKIIRFELR